MTLKPWQVVEETVSFDDPYIKLITQQIKLPTGAILDRFHLLKSRSWAATVALTADKQLIFVEQYRHGHGGLSLELPAGVIEANEDPMAAALREFEEETGYAAQEIEPFWTIRPEPARHQQWAHFGFVREASWTGRVAPDATEDLRVVLRPLEQLDEILSQMVHAVHVGALLLAIRKGLIVV